MWLLVTVCKLILCLDDYKLVLIMEVFYFMSVT